MEGSSRPGTGFSPSATSCSKEHWPALLPKMPLQITTRGSETPDLKFELLPLHSPLLGQSLLVSFPPLIDMLKFSGYPYLIRGVHCRRCCPARGSGPDWRPGERANLCPVTLGLAARRPPMHSSGVAATLRPATPAKTTASVSASVRRSNRHAPRNARGRNVRSKIR
jgi:hypothetical protein